MLISYVDIIIDCSVSMKSLKSWLNNFFDDLFLLRARNLPLDVVDVNFGLTLFESDNVKFIEFPDKKFTPDIKRIRECIQSIKYEGGAADAKEDGIKAIDDSITYKLNDVSVDNKRKALLFFSDCYEFKDGKHHLAEAVSGGEQLGYAAFFIPGCVDRRITELVEAIEEVKAHERSEQYYKADLFPWDDIIKSDNNNVQNYAEDVIMRIKDITDDRSCLPPIQTGGTEI